MLGQAKYGLLLLNSSIQSNPERQRGNSMSRSLDNVPDHLLWREEWPEAREYK